MTRISARFLPLFAASALVVGVASCSDAAQTVPSEEDSLLRFLPADTQGVFLIDVAGLRGNPLVDEWIEEQSEGVVRSWMDGFSGSTELDFRTDVDKFAVALLAGDEPLLVIRPASDRALGGVEEALGAKDIPVETYGNHRIYDPELARDWRMGFVEGFMLVGPGVAIRGAMDRSDHAESTVLDNPQLVGGLRSLDAGAQMRAVGAPSPGGLSERFTPSLASNLLSSLELGTYQMRLDDTVTGEVVGQFATPETARRATDLLRGLVTLGRIQAGPTGFRQFLDGLEIENVDTAVYMNFVVDAQVLRGLRVPEIWPGN